MKFKAVIFDLNGTLIDTFSQSEYESVLGEMATILKAPHDEFIKSWFDTFRERITGTLDAPPGIVKYICDKLNIGATEGEIKRATKVRLDYTINNMIPRPGSIELITSLKSVGYKIGLISDCSIETPKIWPDTVFAPLFDVTIFSCVVGIKKPNPLIYLKAIEQLGVVPQECLYIGDGESQELTGALRVGMNPVLLRMSDKTTDKYFLEREECWNGPVIESFEEVWHLLE